MSLIDELIDELKSEWPARFSLQPITKQERLEVMAIQSLKKSAANEILRLRALIDEHNSQLICDKEKCGYAPYKRDCPDCPKQWSIDL